MAIGKFQGVISPTTPTGSRVTSTWMPGRTESTRSPVIRSASPAKNLKICPARTTSPCPSGRVLPFLARQQPAQLLLARQDLGADLVQRVEPDLRRARPPAREGGTRARDRVLGLLPVGVAVLADHVVDVGRVDVPARAGPLDPLAGDEVLVQHDGPPGAGPDDSARRARGKLARDAQPDRNPPQTTPSNAGSAPVRRPPHLPSSVLGGAVVVSRTPALYKPSPRADRNIDRPLSEVAACMGA